LLYTLRLTKTKETRTHRQSYRHADPYWQPQHTAVAARVTSNRATVMAFVTV